MAAPPRAKTRVFERDPVISRLPLQAKSLLVYFVEIEIRRMWSLRKCFFHSLWNDTDDQNDFKLNCKWCK